MIQLKEACEYLKLDTKTFMEEAILEKISVVERMIEIETFEKDPNTCNECGGPNKPPGSICSECWGREWKNGPHH